MSEERMTHSILEDILDHLVDGELPEDYSLLPPAAEQGMVAWADGARDGISVYHTEKGKPSMEVSSLIELAIRDASGKRFLEAEDFLRQLSKKARTVEVADDFLQFIIQHQNELDPDGLYQFAVRTIYTGSDPELIKFGLAVLELLETGEDERRAIYTLGLSDEFTLYAIYNMRSWENGNDWIFDLAQHVRGWGRIHAVNALSASERKISDWLLYEGIRNNIHPGYSALTVWNKARATKRLFDRISKEEYNAIRDILSALLEEGPMAGISGLEHAELSLVQYVRKSCGFLLGEEDLAVIERISDYQKASGSETLRIALDEFYHEEEPTGTVEEVLLGKIRSRFPKNRAVAYKTIIRWVQGRNLPLEELSTDLYEALSVASELEPESTLREEIIKGELL